MVDVTMVDGGRMKAVLAGQPNRLLPFVRVATLAEATLPVVVAYLRLERGTLLVLWQHFAAKLAVECASSDLTRLDVLSIDGSGSLGE